jgi:acyl-CoA thioesterase
MASLADVTTPHAAGDHYDLEVGGTWRQGRGAFGGLVVGALIRAIEQHTADPTRVVRSVTAELPGPVEHGVVSIAVDTLRAGKNVSTVRAALRQHDEIRAHAVAILAAARPAAQGVGWNERVRPELPAWSTVAASPIGVGVGVWPEFAQHFEFRVVDGLPMTGGAARTSGWVRPRDPGAPRDAAYIAAVIDAWWPAALVRFSTMRPIATIAYTLDIVGGLAGLDPDAPLLHHATVPVCADGYFLETRELWGEDGRLVAINHQTFAIIQ